MTANNTKILLVEDNRGDARLIREELKEALDGKFSLIHADCLKVCVNLLEQNMFDVILLDLGLPDSQGFDTLVRVKDKSAKCPIIVLTGLDSEDIAFKSLREGAQDYLIKDQIDARILQRAIPYAIERKQIQETLREHSDQLADIVEQRTKELREAQEELTRKEKLAMLGQLAGGVGHELRNPLGVINNAVYFLKTILPDAGEQVKEYLGIIADEVKNSDKIVSDLLNISRTKPAERQKVRISDLVDQVLEKFPPPVNVKIDRQISPESTGAFIDPQQISQVIINLITNAYQAMPDGGCLTIGAKPNMNNLILSFADTGCGIKTENINKIFEPLFSTKARGLGFGLSVSKNLLEINGGRIMVESVEGKGSTFTVALPTAEQ